MAGASKRGNQKPQMLQKEMNGQVTISCPVDECFPGYATCWLNLRITPRSAAALKILWSSLSEHGERYSEGPSMNPRGTPVENAQTGIRWLLEKLADEIESQTGKTLVEDFDLQF